MWVLLTAALPIWGEEATMSRDDKRRKALRKQRVHLERAQVERRRRLGVPEPLGDIDPRKRDRDPATRWLGLSARGGLMLSFSPVPGVHAPNPTPAGAGALRLVHDAEPSGVEAPSVARPSLRLVGRGSA